MREEILWLSKCERKCRSGTKNKRKIIMRGGKEI